MILFVHLLLGAAIGQVINNTILAIFLALCSHYFIDLFPHIEYPIGNIRKNQWRAAFPQILSITIDFSLGLLFIFLLSNNKPIIYLCAFFAILPDGLSVLSSLVKINILKSHSVFHQEKIHFLKHKKISNFWRILSQIVVVIISILLFKT